MDRDQRHSGRESRGEQEDIERLRKQVKELNARITSQSSRISELEEHIASQNDHVSVLEARVRSQNDDIVQRNDAILLLEKQLESCNEDCTTEIKSNGILKDRLAKLPLEEDIIDEFVEDIKAISTIQPIGAPSPMVMGSFSYLSFINDIKRHLCICNKRSTNTKFKSRMNFVEFIEGILQNLAGQNNTKLKYLYNVIISCICCYDRKLISIPTYLTMLNIMSVSKSALCADFINFSMIGGVHSRSIYQTYYKLARIFESSKMEIPINYTAIAVFDNNSNDYKGTTWRSGKNQKKSQLVWCNVEAYVYKVEKGRKEEEEEKKEKVYDSIKCNQLKYDLRPSAWINSKKTLYDANLSNITLFGNDNIPNRTKVHPTETLRDIEYRDKEICESILYAITLFADLPKLKAYIIKQGDKSKFGNITYNDITSETKSAVVTAKDIEKTCLYCSKVNFKSASKCKFCDKELRKMADIRQEILGISKELLFKPSPPRVNNKTKTRISSLGTDGKIKHYDMNVSSDSFSIPLEDEFESTDSYIKILRQLLPSIMLNPSSASNVEAIYRIIGRQFKLAGFADPNTLEVLLRYYIYLVSDYGATNLDLLDSNPDFSNFIHIVGTFHECKSFLEITMDLLFSIGGNELAILHTYQSEKAQAYLRRCGDLHKANDFLRDVVKPAMYICIILEYIDTKPDLDFKNINIDDVYTWMNQIPENDLRYQNFIFYVSHILPCYELIKKGVRTGNMEGYNAGRRGLLPFMFALSKTNYGPLLIRDMIQYYWRAPDVIRKELNEIFSLYDEGINGKMEESNKRQKQFTLGDSKLGIQAGALLTDTSILLRDALLKLKGEGSANTSTDIPERRTPTDLNEDIIDCVRYLMEKRVFAKELFKPTIATKFNSEPLKEGGFSLTQLYNEGVELADEYYQIYLSSEKLNLPKCPRHKTFKLLKKRINAVTNEEEEYSEDENDEIANAQNID